MVVAVAVAGFKPKTDRYSLHLDDDDVHSNVVVVFGFTAIF